MKLTTLFFSLLFPGLSLGVEFDPVFSSGMVLQRDAPVRVSGVAGPGDAITVSLGEDSATATANEDGRWSVSLSAKPAGGPHVLKAVDGTESAIAEDVLMGDVWVCSGQSNMQMGLHETIGGQEAMKASHPDIRLLTLPRAAAERPRHALDAGWQKPSPETLRDFSAVAYYFALSLKSDDELSSVPMGIVNTSFGGTAVEAWIPEMPSIPADQVSSSMFDHPPSSLFNAMVAPLTPLTIKGAIWYQGESNAAHPQVYDLLLETMIAQWRGAWKQPELPFLIVQLPAYAGRGGPYDYSWLRDSQSKACANSPNTWMVVTYDTTDGYNLHPIEKSEVGRRAGLMARHEIYQRDVPHQGPTVSAVEVADDEIVVRFETHGDLATSDGQAPTGFVLAGEDREFLSADATIGPDSITLSHPSIERPKFVRYAWGAIPEGNLTDATDLPCAPFRTDDFAPDPVGVQPLPRFYKVSSPDYSITGGEGGRLREMIVRGKSFLSGQTLGGTSIPDAFGPRDMSRTEVAGPHRLRFSDNTGSFEVVGLDEGFDWVITNDRDGAIDFNVHLAPEVVAESDGSSTQLTREGVSLQVEGLDPSEGGDARQLTAKVPGKTTKILHFKILP